MIRPFHHILAGKLFPKYNQRLDQLNQNAALQEWLKKNSIPVFPDRIALHAFMHAEYISGSSVDYLEFGVFQGETILHWADINKNPNSRFFGFDSFEGLPEKWNHEYLAGHFDVQGVTPKTDDARVAWVKGWFNRTLPGFLQSFTPRSKLVIHSDSDLYSSTLYTLTKLDQILIPGTIIIFDEFFSALHEFRAYQDYCSAYGRTLRPIGVTDDGAGRMAFVFE